MALADGRDLPNQWAEPGRLRGQAQPGVALATVSAEVSPLLAAGGASRGAVVLLHDLALHRGAAQALGTAEPDLKLSPAGLAHEVKNPLTGIKGAAELLAGRLRYDPRAQQYCGLILEGVNRITALVEQVLAASSPQRLSFEPVNIHRVLHQALRMAGLHPHPPDGVTIEQLFDPSLPEISADAAALERTFLNLVRNAAEAIGTTGTIRLRTRMETEFRLTRRGAPPAVPARGGERQRPRHERGRDGAALHAVLHHQTLGHRPGPGAEPADRRGPRRQAMGRSGRRKPFAPGAGRSMLAESHHAHPAYPEEHRARGMTFKVTLPVGPRDPEPSEAA